ncbi:bifunctional nuclease domain-containing protein [Acidobacteriota bacterium]
MERKASHLFLALIFCLLIFPGLSSDANPITDLKEDSEYLEMEVREVLVDHETDSPVVILEAKEEAIILPIWVGMNEAIAIATQMEQMEFPRPLTHDLLKDVILGLDAKVARIRITEIKENTFYAKIVLLSNGEPVEVDSRPSDAIALALRTKAPILVQRSVLKEAGEEKNSLEKPESEGTLHSYGLSVQEITTELARVMGITPTPIGILVSDVQPGSPAHDDGLRRKDIILSIGASHANNVGDFRKALLASLSDHQGFTLKVVRDGSSLSIRHSGG